jgi:glycosyltransferase involved in cell wall biosynthesis
MAEHPPRRRILHVVPDLDYGGLQRLIIDMTSRLAQRGFESFVVPLTFPGDLAGELAPAASLLATPRLPPWTMAWPQPLTALMRRVEPTVVHSHTGVWWKATLAARMAGVRRVVHTAHGRHEPDPWHARWLDRWAGALCHDVVAVSEELAARMTRDLGIPPAKLHVIPGGVDTGVFAPRPDDGKMRRELGIDPRAAVIGSVGRLEPVKAYDVMIEALEQLSPGVHGSAPPVLVIVGDGTEMPRLRGRVVERHLEGRVRLVGWRTSVVSLMSGFTLFSLSSTSEGTSVSLLEAMGSGLCPVVTDVGGNAAVLGEALRHRLVPAGDPGALARAWSAALADEARRAADGAEARRRVIAGFSLDAMVDRYELLYGASS